MRPGESPVILFITTALSHLTMLPTPYLFYKRGYLFELCLSIFGLVSSFMYHTCESFSVTVFLSEKQWHRLDNIGIISMMGVWFTFLCCFSNPVVDMACKYSVVLLTVFIQQQHPWDVRFTVAPLMCFSLLPVVQHFLINRRFPEVSVKYLCIGLLSSALALPFFIVGLDETKDKYRMCHGAWHFFGGCGSFFFWLMIRYPGATGVQVKHSHMVMKGDISL